MKKLSLNPLSLHKQTIALLDFNQLQTIAGGMTAACQPGGSGHWSSNGGGGSTGCGSGSSTCRTK
ncbi:MAG: class I lanthipeptide [Saprospiraceae bacterium]